MEYDFVPFCDRRCCLSHHDLCTFYESINRPLTSDCIKSATVSGPPHTISLLPSNKGALFIVTFLLSAERQGRKRQREREQFLCYFIGLPYSNHWVLVVFYFTCQWFNFQFHCLGWCCGVSAWKGSPCRVMEFSTRESNTVSRAIQDHGQLPGLRQKDFVFSQQRTNSIPLQCSPFIPFSTLL